MCNYLECTGTLEVGIAEEDTGRILDFNVSAGSAIVVPQGDRSTFKVLCIIK